MILFVCSSCPVSRYEKGLEGTNCVEIGAWDWESRSGEIMGVGLVGRLGGVGASDWGGEREVLLSAATAQEQPVSFDS
jgi:hypothetical protein